ncbi:MAG: hypothetical protein AAF399_22205 [Bacteroidota bacterium]
MRTTQLLSQGFRYPYFEANQVLKSNDLNQIITYLSQQQRLTRSHLIGMGILCGLELNYETDPVAVMLSGGTGLSSEGYLIHLPDTLLTHVREVQLDAFLFGPGEWFQGSGADGQQVQGWELLSSGEGENQLDSSQIHPLADGYEGADGIVLTPEEFLGNKVVLLLMEPIQNRRNGCLVDCDDKGVDVSYRIRVLLLPESGEFSAHTLLERGYPQAELPKVWEETEFSDLFHSWYGTTRIKVRRFGPVSSNLPEESDPTLAEGADLRAIQNVEAYQAGYRVVCTAAITSIETAFPHLFCLFSPFVSSIQEDGTEFTNLAALLKETLDLIVPKEPASPNSPDNQFALQGFYDYLLDIVAAYDELREAAFDLMADCPPDLNRFPKYLMLGPVPVVAKAADALPSPYRSHFSQPPMYQDNHRRLREVKSLYQRLKLICFQADEMGNTLAFTFLPYTETKIKLTPSQGRTAPLSQRAIPFYHRYAEVVHYWSYEHTRKGRSREIPAYFHLADVEDRQDWLYNIDGVPFFRVEGHIGRDNAEAVTQIAEYQRHYNLPFDIVSLKLAPTGSIRDVQLTGQFDDLEQSYTTLVKEFQAWYEIQEFGGDIQPLMANMLEILVNGDQVVPLSEFAVRPGKANQPNSTEEYRSFFSQLLYLAQDARNYRWWQADSAIPTFELVLVDEDVTPSQPIVGPEPFSEATIPQGITVELPPEVNPPDQAVRDGLKSLIQQLVEAFSCQSSIEKRLADHASLPRLLRLGLGLV